VKPERLGHGQPLMDVASDARGACAHQSSFLPEKVGGPGSLRMDLARSLEQISATQSPRLEGLRQASSLTNATSQKTDDSFSFDYDGSVVDTWSRCDELCSNVTDWPTRVRVELPPGPAKARVAADAQAPAARREEPRQSLAMHVVSDQSTRQSPWVTGGVRTLSRSGLIAKASLRSLHPVTRPVLWVKTVRVDISGSNLRPLNRNSDPLRAQSK
jgi:hypothetical protein